MLLGTVIGRLGDETQALEMLASLDDIVLLARMQEAAAAAGEPLGSFASAAVGAFLAQADDAAWLSLMAVAGKAEDPGSACLKYILTAALQEPRPSCRHREVAPTASIEHGDHG